MYILNYWYTNKLYLFTCPYFNFIFHWLSNCTLYSNNTACQYGGGVDIELKRGGNG